MPSPSTIARFRRWFGVLLAMAVFSSVGAALFAVGALVHSLGSPHSGTPAVLAQVSVVFALLGAIYGTVVALDRSADSAPLPKGLLRQINSPKVRTLVCAALGGLVVVVVSSWSPSPFPFVIFALGAVGGASLGWYGWRWAKHVDF